jgi:hypothetical protein
MPKLSLTQHVTARAQQRGITPAQVDAVVRYADSERPRGGGCVSIWISRRALRRFGRSTPEGVSIDRLLGVTLLQGSDDTCVTVFRDSRSKAYRRAVGRRR